MDKENEAADFAKLLAAARSGSGEALGRLLMTFRDYLLLAANRQLDAGLRSKLSPSDLVQETFLEAQRDFRRFHGEREEELLAWLGRLLTNNVANSSRSYHATEKRDVKRELALDGGGAGHEPVLDTPSPSERVAALEEERALQAAMAHLPENYRQVLHMRYQERQTFAQIGAALGCSAEAARKLWGRAVHRLQKELKRPYEP